MCAERFAGSIDVEIKHRHRGLVGCAFPSLTVFGRAFEGRCDLTWAIGAEYADF